MAAPQNRHSIKVNRYRRRNPQKLIKVENNIDIGPEHDHLKQKHVLCGYCNEKVRKEIAEIRLQLGKQKAPLVEAVMLHTGETRYEHNQGKRILEQDRKWSAWFPQN
ncbi:39S ribosomal protein L32, mitochondrial [Sciurus carolinensis]|uniref:Large ribosomal subunit protein bL32m n=1 Tax=Sciurus carolinensis TaxID=30640 RepID=A0AA41MHF9_SCICA|nr:39S ribosomal protein L32, mitochondrial [Sciurus carolinensis]